MFKILFFLLAILLTVPAFSTVITLKTNNLVVLNTEINGASTTKAMVEIQKLNIIDTSEPIYLLISSPGGSVFDGVEFIRFAKTSRRIIHTVTIYAASMAFQIVQSLPGKRYIAEGGYFMSHRSAISNIGGQMPGELENRIDYMAQLTKELDTVIAKRAKITLKHYADLIHDEYYAYPIKALKDHFADEKVDLSCDASLQGTHLTPGATMAGKTVFEFADCPLISNPIKEI